MSFMPCELHCHTLHSDGSFEVAELQRSARSSGLSVIALTDHNTLSGHNEINPDIIPVIRGIEWTTYYGHMLVLGANGFIDWRDAVPDNIDEKIKAVKADGGIVGIAHPFQIGSPVCTGGRWEFNVHDMTQVSYIEVWHEDIGTLRSENVKALALWNDLLDKGLHLPASYGRDWHRQEQSGTFGCTYLDLDEPTAQCAINAIKNGRTVISTGALIYFALKGNGRQYKIGDTVPEGRYDILLFTDLARSAKGAQYDCIKIISNGNTTVLEAKADCEHAVITLESEHWYRAELWGTLGGEHRALAIASPVYCR